MIPVMPVAAIEKRVADERGLTQVQIRDELIAEAASTSSHPHPEGLAPNGQPEVIYRTVTVTYGDDDANSYSVEIYCIWIEKDEDQDV